MCKVKLSKAAKACDVCICPFPRSKSKYDGEHLIFPWQDSSPTKVSKNHLPESIQILWIRPKDRGTNTKATNNRRYHIHDLNYLIGGEKNTLKRTWKTRRFVLQSAKKSSPGLTNANFRLSRAELPSCCGIYRRFRQRFRCSGGYRIGSCERRCPKPGWGETFWSNLCWKILVDGWVFTDKSLKTWCF